nr:hypothetical protein [Tanacetum cinerariifolium]
MHVRRSKAKTNDKKLKNLKNEENDADDVSLLQVEKASRAVSIKGLQFKRSLIFMLQEFEKIPDIKPHIFVHENKLFIFVTGPICIYKVPCHETSLAQFQIQGNYRLKWLDETLQKGSLFKPPSETNEPVLRPYQRWKKAHYKEALRKSDQVYQTFKKRSLAMTRKLDDMIELPKSLHKKISKENSEYCIKELNVLARAGYTFVYKVEGNNKLYCESLLMVPTYEYDS